MLTHFVLICKTLEQKNFDLTFNEYIYVEEAEKFSVCISQSQNDTNIFYFSFFVLKMEISSLLAPAAVNALKKTNVYYSPAEVRPQKCGALLFSSPYS